MINSSHFAQTFNLPINQNDEEGDTWRRLIYARAEDERMDHNWKLSQAKQGVYVREENPVEGGVEHEEGKDGEAVEGEEVEGRVEGEHDEEEEEEEEEQEEVADEEEEHEVEEEEEEILNGEEPDAQETIEEEDDQDNEGASVSNLQDVERERVKGSKDRKKGKESARPKGQPKTSSRISKPSLKVRETTSSLSEAGDASGEHTNAIKIGSGKRKRESVVNVKDVSVDANEAKPKPPVSDLPMPNAGQHLIELIVKPPKRRRR